MFVSGPDRCTWGFLGSSGLLPRRRLGTYGRRAFAAAGPTVWNSLPDYLRDPEVTNCRQLQALVENVFVFSVPVRKMRIICVTVMSSTSLHFTYLLTCLLA